MTIISKDISKAISLLKNNAIVAIPTETVYGLAGNIYSENAIRKIFEVKKRPHFNPLIVHVDSLKKVEALVSEFPEKAKLLAEAFWPGSLTLILKKNSTVPDVVTAGKDTVAIRIPNHPVTLGLLQQLPFPLAAPSANPFGSISPTSATHVENYFKDAIEMVLDGGTCKNGIESTIIGFENNEPVLYRLGSISIEEITKIIGDIKIKNKQEIAPNAPGMLERHYAPSTKTFLVHDVAQFIKNYPDKHIGVLVFSKAIVAPNIKKLVVLSKKKNLKEAASKLYKSLHDLDNLHLDMIVTETFPDVELGKSINDRLERATKD
ncbi:L-threonylcarbamoyladenylate synthase [Cellulophaga sp. Hel_I_12]|uniref:L-threonylcarbamoyladenylate synthase n=1 Tax=Cellulophaga sp. Hel_I_12 TaxID=1249972 RepID=UPI000647C261|nr:L-threonylcarbamoyladenylate synthase [Cellulophaga sp. Hel_I_12]